MGTKISMSLRVGIVALPSVGKSTLAFLKFWYPSRNVPFSPAAAMIMNANSKIHYYQTMVTKGHQSMYNKQIERRRIPASNHSAVDIDSPLSGMEDVMIGYLLGKRKATEVAHLVWTYIVQKGDTVVDATCGNGHDTLTLAKLVTEDKTLRGNVYSLDVQKVALLKTLALLDESLDKDEKEIVKLVETCHSKMHEVVPKGEPVKLVAFNLGYLPGGDKAVITGPKTTLMALEAAKNMLIPGGLISIVCYIGHPGGREEFETVRDFGSRLPVDEWSCCELQMLNRPLAPVLVFMFKR